MTTTREDRERAAGFADYAGGDDVSPWVESGKWPRDGKRRYLRSSLDKTAAAFAAHREAAERATVERIERELLATVEITIEMHPTGLLSSKSVDAGVRRLRDDLLRIVRGEAKGGST